MTVYPIQADDAERRIATQERMYHKFVLGTYISGIPLKCPLNKSLDLVHSALFGVSNIEGVGSVEGVESNIGEVGSGSGSVGRGN